MYFINTSLRAVISILFKNIIICMAFSLAVIGLSVSSLLSDTKHSICFMTLNQYNQTNTICPSFLILKEVK